MLDALGQLPPMHTITEFVETFATCLGCWELWYAEFRSRRYQLNHKNQSLPDRKFMWGNFVFGIFGLGFDSLAGTLLAPPSDPGAL